MQAANKLQKALRGSGVTFGAWQMLPGSSHARTIARCGYDWVLVDTEHGNIDGTICSLLHGCLRRGSEGEADTAERRGDARSGSCDCRLWCEPTRESSRK